MRAPAVLLCLAAGGAFLAGWSLARRTPEAQSPAGGGNLSDSPSQTGIPSRSLGNPGPENSGLAVSAGSDAQFPGVADPQVLAALRNPDLTAAVNDIMSRSEEDHCADTRLIQLMEMLPESRLAEIPALLGNFLQEDFVLGHLLTTWAERQTEAALAWADHQAVADSTLLVRVLTGWTRRSPDAALEWTLSQPLSTNTRALQTVLIETLAEADPAKAFSLMKDIGWINTNSQAVLRMVRNWGSQDPAAALQAIRGMAAHFDRKTETSGAPEGEGNPAVGAQFPNLLSALLSGSASRPSSETQSLLRQLSPQETEAGATSIARDFLMHHPSAIQALAANPRPEVHEKALLRALAGRGSLEVLERMAGFEEADFRQELLSAIAGPEHYSSGLGRSISRSPAARTALREGLAELDETQRAPLTLRFSLEMAESAPDLATSLWQQLPPAPQKENGSRFFYNVAEHAPEEALKMWTSSSPEIRGPALRGLVAGMVGSDPERALSLALGQSDPTERNTAIAVTLAHWGQIAPHAAAQLERLAPELDLAAIKPLFDGAGQIGATYHFMNNQTVRDRLESLLPASTNPP